VVEGGKLRSEKWEVGMVKVGVWGEGWGGRGGSGEGAKGLVGRCASAEGWWGEGRVGALRARGRAVILTAVQSLRLRVRRGAGGESGLIGERRAGAQRSQGACSEGAGRRTSCARESCNSDSSPEPSAACSEGAGGERGEYGGLLGRVRVGALRARGRAVILTAVQSLRLRVRGGAWSETRAGRPC
jgi:hypothetical protein